MFHEPEIDLYKSLGNLERKYGLMDGTEQNFEETFSTHVLPLYISQIAKKNIIFLNATFSVGYYF